MLFTRRCDVLLGFDLPEFNSDRPNLSQIYTSRRSFCAILLRKCLSIPTVIFTVVAEPETIEPMHCKDLVYVGSVTTFL